MKKKLIIIVSAALTLGSCSKHYFDINNNPNAATNTTPDLVLPNALVVTASTQCMAPSAGTSYNFISAWMGYLAQSGSYATGPTDMASYKQTTLFGDLLWIGRYRNLEDYDYIEKSATAAKLPFYQGAAKIMKAFVLQQLVDLFNNVPYSQAFNGTNTITPKYDSAQSIYNAITLQLDSAIILMQNPLATATKTSDVLFSGNTTSWIQFANTLKLRILIRQTQVAANQSFIQGEYAKIAANGAGFLTADAGVNPGYASNTNQQSPIWGYFVTITNTPTSGGQADLYKAAQYPITWCQNHDDPRYEFIYAQGGKGWVGCILGGGSNNPAGTDGATIGKGILKGASQPAIILSAAESYFLQAEANLRGLIPGDAATNYINGVTANFNYLGAYHDTIKTVNPPQVDSIVFNTSTSVARYTTRIGDKQTNYGACTNFNEQLACIIRQKWIAMDMITPFEAYCDYRRLHLPADIPLSISGSVDLPQAIAVPIRYLYPISEYNTNTVNVNAQGTIDYHKSPVFWNQ